MSNARFGVFSMSARSPDGTDARYIEWHSLDHHPEQYALDGIVLGQRWVSTPACRAARVPGHERFDEVDHVMQYLFTDSSKPTLDEWFALGAQLRESGRMPYRLPAVELGGYELVDRGASAHALVSAEVVPWRPVRGGYLVVEQGDAVAELSDLCAMPGVAGAWRFRGGVFHDRLADTSGLVMTVLYLDDDAVETGVRIGGALSARWKGSPTAALMAAPFECVTPWAWDRALPG